MLPGLEKIFKRQNQLAAKGGNYWESAEWKRLDAKATEIKLNAMNLKGW